MQITQKHEFSWLETAPADPPGAAATRLPETELKNYTALSGTTVHGRAAIVIGLLCAALGSVPLLAAGGMLHLKGVPKQTPHWALVAGGGVFVLPGLWLIAHGARGLRLRRRRAALRAAGAQEPWRLDHEWNESGAQDQQRRDVRAMLFAAVVMVLIAAPFHLIALKDGGLGAKVFVFGCIDLLAGLMIFALIARTLALLKHGSGRVQFRRFPYFVGERLEIDYIPARPLASVTNLKCVLHCIREEYRTEQSGGKTRTTIVGHESARSEKTLDAASLSGGFDRCISLAFEVPSEARSTQLAEAPPTYWELVVTAEMPGLDLESRFLLPVYRRT